MVRSIYHVQLATEPIIQILLLILFGSSNAILIIMEETLLAMGNKSMGFHSVFRYVQIQPAVWTSHGEMGLAISSQLSIPQVPTLMFGEQSSLHFPLQLP